VQLIASFIDPVQLIASFIGGMRSAQISSLTETPTTIQILPTGYSTARRMQRCNGSKTACDTQQMTARAAQFLGKKAIPSLCV
jgi:hypothetical protein